MIKINSTDGSYQKVDDVYFAEKLIKNRVRDEGSSGIKSIQELDKSGGIIRSYKIQLNVDLVPIS